MKSSFDILGVNKDSDINSIKDAYYKKIAMYPPEKNPEMFINISNAYQNAVKEYKYKKELLLKYKKLVQSIINKENNYNYVDSMKDILKTVNIDNFKEQNDMIIDCIMELKHLGYIGQSLVFSFMAQNKFDNLGLKNLAFAYTSMQHFIVFG